MKLKYKVHILYMQGYVCFIKDNIFLNTFKVKELFLFHMKRRTIPYLANIQTILGRQIFIFLY